MVEVRGRHKRSLVSVAVLRRHTHKETFTCKHTHTDTRIIHIHREVDNRQEVFKRILDGCTFYQDLIMESSIHW